MSSAKERQGPSAEESRPVKVQRREDVTEAAATTRPEAAAKDDDSKENVCLRSSGATADAAELVKPEDCFDPLNGSNNNASNNSTSTNNTNNSTSNSSTNNSNKELEAAWAETEHRNWAVNTGLLYDVVISIPLDWPSLTVQWLPTTTPGAGSTVKQRLLVGTHTSGAEQDALLVMQVELPSEPIEDGRGNEFKERGDYEGFHFGHSSYKVKVVKRLPHPQESNCARYMPQRPSILASCAVDGRVLLYDLEAAGVCEGPDAFYTGHKGEATCVSWNPYHEGFVASCGSGGSLAVHDASTALKTAAEGGSVPLFLGERPSGMNSCCWAEADVVVGAAEDGIVALWDTRVDPKTSIAEVSCEGKAVNSVTANQLKPELILCGGDDGVLRLFDRRRLGCCAHEMEGHGQSKVSVVSFSQHTASLLLSGGFDKFVSLWDLEKIGCDQDPEDAEDGPPELLFTHGGHRADVYDAAWNCEEAFKHMVASVADDNKLHIWTPKASVFFESESEDEADEDDGVELE